MSRSLRKNLLALGLGLGISLLAYACVANAQTRNDQQQDRTSRATAQQVAATNAAQDRARGAENLAQDRRQANRNAIQDKAVIADQIRQDDADEVRDIQIAKSVKLDADTENAVQNAIAKASGQQVLKNTVALASTDARVEAVVEQSITDRQFMAFLSMVIGGMLLAQWLMQRGSARRLENAANTLVERTEMLEAHIAETTPAVIEAYKKTRE